MRVFVITAVHIENDEINRVKGYLSSVELSLFFPPSQFPVEFTRNEMIGLIRQGNIFDKSNKDGKRIPLLLNTSTNKVSLETAQFNDVERY